MGKLTSRKFWIAVATMAANVGAGLYGLFSDNQIVLIVAICLLSVSAAIYNAIEGKLDSDSIFIDGQLKDVIEESSDNEKGEPDNG